MKKIIQLLVMVSLTLGLISCAVKPTELPGSEKVKLMKADPPSNCEEVKSIQGNHTWFTSADQEIAKINLKNAAVKLGANYVRMETVEKQKNDVNDSVTIHGTAFKCPSL